MVLVWQFSQDSSNFPFVKVSQYTVASYVAITCNIAGYIAHAILLKCEMFAILILHVIDYDYD